MQIYMVFPQSISKKSADSLKLLDISSHFCFVKDSANVDIMIHTVQKNAGLVKIQLRPSITV